MPADSVFTKKCVFLNYNYGIQQILLSKYIDFNFHPTYIILHLNFIRAIKSHYAIIYYNFYLYIFFFYFLKIIFKFIYLFYCKLLIINIYIYKLIIYLLIYILNLIIFYYNFNFFKEYNIYLIF